MVEAEAKEEVEGVAVVEEEGEDGQLAEAPCEDVQLGIFQGWLVHRQAHL